MIAIVTYYLYLVGVRGIRSLKIALAMRELWTAIKVLILEDFNCQRHHPSIAALKSLPRPLEIEEPLAKPKTLEVGISANPCENIINALFPFSYIVECEVNSHELSQDSKIKGEL